MHMRLRVALGIVLVALAATGSAACTARAEGAAPTPTPTPTPRPLAEAGGACQLLDYATIKATLGIDLAVGAAGKQGETYTCVVQPAGGSYPDLVLAVTATKIDDAVFRSVVQPGNGASPVSGLGKVAYTVDILATSGAGPGVEIGWLAGNARLIVLRYRLTPDASPEKAAEVAPKAIELAKAVDRSSI